MQRGYIKIWRKLEDSGLLQMHGTLALFLVMLMKAVYKPCRVGTAELDRGQLSAGVHQLSGWTKLSTQSVRTCLKHLHNMDIITSKSTNQYTIYTIVNYNEYQDIDTLPNKPLTNDQQTTNKQLTTEEDINTLSIKNKSNTIKPKRKTKTKLPEFIEATDSHIDFAKQNNLSIHEEMVNFRLHHEAKLTMSGNWNSSFSTWLHNAVKFKRPSFTAKQDSLKRTGDLLTGRARENDTVTINMD